MTLQSPQGHFLLKSQVRLLEREQGGILWQHTPLRALRLNRGAYELLRRCRSGLFWPPPEYDPENLAPRFAFLKTLWQQGWLEWLPAAGVYEPKVSIVIPVYNRESEIGDCLTACLALHYPAEKLEIIVVDDGSTDKTREVVRKYPVKLLALERNQGQSAARNRGVAAATGEIIAFLDSDCLAEPQWLQELLPYFQDPQVALVGGYVASYYQSTAFDRYEDACSPLNMGEHPAFGLTPTDDFYVPTCNLLVRRESYQAVGGLREDLRVGEDVDFCWRLKEQGCQLLYLPRGRVFHKHRNRLGAACRRRFDYGTSEAHLFRDHSQVRKKFPWRPWSLAVCGSLAVGLATITPQWLLPAAAIWLLAAWRQQHQLAARVGLALPYYTLLLAVAKEYLAFGFYLSYHLLRYYLPLVFLLFLLPPAGYLLAGLLLLLPVGLEYHRRRPRLHWLLFSGYFLLEQLCYQAGVFWGCWQQRCFRPYHLHFGPARPGLQMAGSGS